MKKLTVIISLFALLGSPFSISAAGYSNPATQFDQILDYVLQGIEKQKSSLDLAVQYYQKYETSVMSPLMRQLAAVALLKMQETTLTWIRSGFHGPGPAFIVNPDAYFKNIANETITPELQALQRDVGNIFSNSTIGQVILGVRAVRSLTPDQLRYTLGGTIQKSLCNEENLRNMATQDIDAGLYSGPRTNSRVEQIAYKQRELNSQLCLGQAQGNRVLQQNLTNCFNKNFSCGGWDAWLGLTTNPNNTAYGQASRASIRLNQKANDAITKNVGQFVNGLQPKIKCVEYDNSITNDDEGNPIPQEQRPCKRTEVVTPAASVANSLFGSQQSGIQQAANTQGQGFQGALMSALVTGMLQRAMEGIASTGGSGRNSSNVGTLTIDANGRVSTVYTNTNPVNTGNPRTPTPIESPILTSLIPQFDRGIATLIKIKATLNTSLSLLTSYEANIISLEQCYASLPASASDLQASGRDYIRQTRETYVPELNKVRENQADIAIMISKLNAYKQSLVRDPSPDNLSKILTDYTNALANGKIFNEADEFQLKAEYDQYKKRAEDDRKTNLNPKLQECQAYGSRAPDDNG